MRKAARIRLEGENEEMNVVIGTRKPEVDVNSRNVLRVDVIK